MLENILEQFGITGTPEPLGEGHINSTFRVGGYVVQRINTDVFTNRRDGQCLRRYRVHHKKAHRTR